MPKPDTSLADVLRERERLFSSGTRALVTSKRGSGRSRGHSWTCPYCVSPNAGLICRPQARYTGCNRALPVDVPWGQYPERHVAFVGPTPQLTLGVLEGFSRALGQGVESWIGMPSWHHTSRELEVVRHLLRSDPGQLDRASPRADSYSLFYTGLFSAWRTSALTRAVRSLLLQSSGLLLQLHYMPPTWLVTENSVKRMGAHLAYDRARDCSEPESC